jgi:hypothetical protein
MQTVVIRIIIQGMIIEMKKFLTTPVPFDNKGLNNPRNYLSKTQKERLYSNEIPNNLPSPTN